MASSSAGLAPAWQGNRWLNGLTVPTDAGRLFGIHSIRPSELLEKLNGHTCNVIQFSKH